MAYNENAYKKFNYIDNLVSGNWAITQRSIDRLYYLERTPCLGVVIEAGIGLRITSRKQEPYGWLIQTMASRNIVFV